MVGTLSLELSGRGTARVSFDPAGSLSGSQLRAHLAMLGFGVSTPVHGGENAGRVLEEDFVVIGYRSAVSHGEPRRWTIELPEPVPADLSRRAVVAWVSTVNDPAPVQAVATWLP